MNKEERDKIRDPEAFNAYQQQQDLARRRKAGLLTPEEYLRVMKQLKREGHEAGVNARIEAAANYRKRVDEINRKKQVRRAAKAKEDYLIRVANEKIEEANKQKTLAFDLEKEIAELEAISDLHETSEEEFARYH